MPEMPTSRLGLSPKLYELFDAFLPAVDSKQLMCTIVLKEEYSPWWEQRTPRFCPIVVRDEAHALEVLLKYLTLHTEYTNGKDANHLNARFANWQRRNFEITAARPSVGRPTKSEIDRK